MVQLTQALSSTYLANPLIDVRRTGPRTGKYLAFVDSLMLRICVSRCACGTPMLSFSSCRAWNISCTKYTVPHINCQVPVSARQKNPCWLAKFRWIYTFPWCGPTATHAATATWTMCICSESHGRKQIFVGSALVIAQHYCSSFISKKMLPIIL